MDGLEQVTWALLILNTLTYKMKQPVGGITHMRWSTQFQAQSEHK